MKVLILPYKRTMFKLYRRHFLHSYKEFNNKSIFSGNEFLAMNFLPAQIKMKILFENQNKQAGAELWQAQSS